jgi:hypothetical protein
MTLMIGTKLHQQTRKSITKRQPALLSSIRRFNDYCTTLARLHNPDWSIPLPQPLPKELNTLRDHSDLMEDIWISPMPSGIPRWLQDRQVQEGIQGMLKLDRCTEECERLIIEAANLCDWFGHEFAGLELALHKTKCMYFFIFFRYFIAPFQVDEPFHILLKKWQT